MAQVTRLTEKQVRRNSLQMAVTFNNSVSALNALLAKKAAAEKRLSEIKAAHTTGKLSHNEEWNELRKFVGSFDANASAQVDGRSTQNCGMLQFMAIGRCSFLANTIFNFYTVEDAIKLLLHSVVFEEDLRLRDKRAFKLNSIKIMWCRSVGHDGRPLSWEWINWDGQNHVQVLEHNEGLTFEHTVWAE